MMSIYPIMMLSQKINSFIDRKTAWVNRFERINIAKNAAANIHAPDDTITGIAGSLGSVITNLVQQATPISSLLVAKLTSGSLANVIGLGPATPLGPSPGGIRGLAAAGVGFGGAIGIDGGGQVQARIGAGVGR